MGGAATGMGQGWGRVPVGSSPGSCGVRGLFSRPGYLLKLWLLAPVCKVGWVVGAFRMGWEGILGEGKGYHMGRGVQVLPQPAPHSGWPEPLVSSTHTWRPWHLSGFPCEPLLAGWSLWEWGVRSKGVGLCSPCLLTGGTLPCCAVGSFMLGSLWSPFLERCPGQQTVRVEGTGRGGERGRPRGGSGGGLGQ